MFAYAVPAACAVSTVGSASIRIVENGHARALIVIPLNASQEIKSAAETLQSYLEKSTGAKLVIQSGDKAFPKPNFVRIRIGVSPVFAKKHRIDLGNLDDDGFVITFSVEKNIVIAGPTDFGTEFGVYEFLERYVGVRWLLPGPDGEDVPKHLTLDIPTDEVKEEPAFFSRRLTGLRGKTQFMWARRNRMHDRIRYGHNLFKLFPPETYTRTHPEFFPVYDGKRYLPKKNSDYRWQPCFSAAGIVEEAVKNICKYFAEHPEETSYSLGINDAGKHCECQKCLAKNSGKINYMGRRNYSDIYFEWANSVVEQVLKEYPNKWFGCLAHNNLADPPARIKVHPRIIPYMTYDRLKWIDADVESEGEKYTRLWAEKASVLGWYDYVYGTPYCLPRVYFHKMSQYYQLGHAQGVRAMKAEAYPNWGEGPKLYVALKLQWNPYLDVDARLDDWYVSAVGEEAAPDLASYYNLWEQFWTHRIKRSKWFTKKGTYLNFKVPDYLQLVTFEDIAESRKLLESVVAKARTKKQCARAEMLLHAFEYYEASAISYLGIVKNLKRPSKNLAYFRQMNKKRFELIHKFEEDPVLIHPVRFDDKRFRKLIWGNR